MFVQKMCNKVEFEKKKILRNYDNDGEIFETCHTRILQACCKSYVPEYFRHAAKVI
jgi:superfamily I DNA and RNA helicase